MRSIIPRQPATVPVMAPRLYQSTKYRLPQVALFYILLKPQTDVVTGCRPRDCLSDYP